MDCVVCPGAVTPSAVEEFGLVPGEKALIPIGRGEDLAITLRCSA